MSCLDFFPAGARRGAAAVALALIASTASAAAPLQYTVPGMTMPWMSSGTLNKDYAFGIGDGAAPVDVPLKLLRAHTGDTIVVTYVSGTVSAEDGTYPYTDADGDTSFLANNGSGNGYGVFPSYYMTPYPIYLCELVGTFANKNGKIVGQPFAIADGPTVLVVPAKASVLLLGANDDKFSDNAGSWVVSISKQKG